MNIQEHDASLGISPIGYYMRELRWNPNTVHAEVSFPAGRFTAQGLSGPDVSPSERVYTGAVPVLLRTRGYRFFFYSLEDREPPHIHVAQAGRYAKFWLDPVTLASNRGFRSHELTVLRELVLENKTLFLERWNAYFGGQE